eukprot:g4424.t1
MRMISKTVASSKNPPPPTTPIPAAAITSDVPVPHLLRSLDLSSNTLRVAGCRALAGFVKSESCDLETLRLSDCRMTDSAATHVLGGLAFPPRGGGSRRLKTLDLSSNQITGQRYGSGEQLRVMLSSTCKQLETLSLRWNQIQGTGALSFVEGLSMAPALKTLDVAFNALGKVIRSRKLSNGGGNGGGAGGGSGNGGRSAGGGSSRSSSDAVEAIETLAYHLANNKVLTHVHLDGNKFDSEACRTLGAALESNHTIAGLHFEESTSEGQRWIVDPLGFLTQEAFHEKMHALQFVHDSMTNKLENGGSAARCWICGGWTAQRFDWVVPCRDEPADPIAAAAAAAAADGAATEVGGQNTKIEGEGEAAGNQTATTSSSSAASSVNILLLSPQGRGRRSSWLSRSSAKLAAKLSSKTGGGAAGTSTTGEPGDDDASAPTTGSVVPRQRGSTSSDQMLFVHLSFDSFKPFPLTLTSPDGEPYAERMCPPGLVSWYFSTDRDLRRKERELAEAKARAKKAAIEAVTRERAMGIGPDAGGDKAGGGTDQSEAQAAALDGTDSGVALTFEQAERRASLAVAAEAARAFELPPRPDKNVHKMHCERGKAVDRLFTEPRIRPGHEDRKDTRFSKPRKEKGPQGWKPESSIFAPRKREAPCHALFENNKFISRCFDADWKQSRAAHMCQMAHEKSGGQVDQGVELVRATFREHYRMLIDVFKYYSCQGRNMRPFGIAWMAFTELCKDAKIVDDPDAAPPSTGSSSRRGSVASLVLQQTAFTISELDAIFIATNVEEKGTEGNDHNQDNAIERFELIEALIRVAMEKFDGAQAVADAVLALFDNHIVPHAAHISPYPFRRERLYFEEIEAVFLAFWQDLRKIYAHFADVFIRGTDVLSLQGLVKLFATAHYLDNDFTREESKIVFVLSQPIYVDEMKTQSHMFLSWVDFLEAIGRTTDHKALPPKYAPPEEDDRPPRVKIAYALYVLITGLQRHDHADLGADLMCDGLNKLGVEMVPLRKM